MESFVSQKAAISGPSAAPAAHVHRNFLWRISLIAGLGGVLYGFDMGIIAAALVFVRESFTLSTRMQEIVIASADAPPSCGAAPSF
jgi:hypothetical protein